MTQQNYGAERSGLFRCGNPLHKRSTKTRTARQSPDRVIVLNPFDVPAAEVAAMPSKTLGARRKCYAPSRMADEAAELADALAREQTREGHQRGLHPDHLI
jgi:hypothetical protein